MSRPLRLEFPGSLHHVTSRGNARQNIFLNDADREFFLHLLGISVNRFSWILTAYVLMSNHFHLVIELTDETLSRGMQWLNSQYARTFNRRHRRVGHLVQGRPDVRVIEKETYGLEVLRYVILNPVRAGMMALPEDYLWSSYRAVLGMTDAPDWLAVDDALVQFGPDRDLARAAYRDFVNAAIGRNSNLWRDLAGQIFLGGDDWIECMRTRVGLKLRSNDHPRLQRLVGPPSMDGIIRVVADMFSIHESRIRHGRGGTARMLAAWMAWHEGKLTNAEIAAGLRLRHSGHISRLAVQCDELRRRNRRFRDHVDACLSTLCRSRAQGKL
jgi:putative transposase